MKELIGKFVIEKETGKECRVVNATLNSIEIFRTKNENFYVREVKCNRCGKIALVEKEEKFRCNSKIEIKLEKDLIGEIGETRTVNCGGKAIEIKKHFKGIDCSQWFDRSWFERFFEVK